MVKDKIIPESELILNPDGSVYHLKIRPEHLADSVILVGDPGRVEMISGQFDHVEFEGQNREFVIHTGMYRNKRVTAMSTGMGTDNIDIVLNELDALVNIDLTTRTLRRHHRSLKLFRLGTSGSLQPDLPLNAVVVSDFGLGFDGILYFYTFEEGNMEQGLKRAILRHIRWNSNLPTPYLFRAAPSLKTLLEDQDVYNGITVTAPGFYGPQGRTLRLPLADPSLNDRLQSFEHNDLRILNYEMETSALYGLSHLLGHQAITVCLAIANRTVRAVQRDHHSAMQDLTTWLLNKISEHPG